MKAGIYKRCDNGKHVYVSGSGYVRAFQLSDVHPLEDKKIKVKTRNKETEIEFKDGDGADVLAFRVADAQAPYTNDVALAHYLKGAADAKAEEDAIAEVQHPHLHADILNDTQPLSIEWKDGREDKQFSRQVVYGYGPGFLTEQMAAAERWLVQTTAQLDALVESGILSRLHDEYTVLDEVRYAAYLQECFHVEPERLVGMPHTLGLGYGADAIDKDGNAVVFKTGTSVGKTTNEQLDIYQQFARDIYGVTDADRKRMRALGFRPCHKQSARKHRKAGHIVVGEGSGVYWWMKKAA